MSFTLTIPHAMDTLSTGKTAQVLLSWSFHLVGKERRAFVAEVVCTEYECLMVSGCWCCFERVWEFWWRGLAGRSRSQRFLGSVLSLASSLLSAPRPPRGKKAILPFVSINMMLCPSTPSAQPWARLSKTASQKQSFFSLFLLDTLSQRKVI